MAIQTPVNQDIDKIKNNFSIGLSFREFAYGACALLLGVGFILGTMNFIGINIASIGSIIIVLPIGACGFFNINELYLFDICKSILFQPTKLIFKTEIKTALSKKEIKQKKKEEKKQQKQTRRKADKNESKKL